MPVNPLPLGMLDSRYVNVTGDSMTGTLTLINTGLLLLDTNASHTLNLKPGSDLTGHRILTITTGDADRTITINGNTTLNDWFDQAVKAASSPSFTGLTVGQLEISATTASPILTITALSDTVTYDPKIVLRDGATPGTRWEIGYDNSDSNRLIISPLLGDTYPPLSMLPTGKAKFQIPDNDTESFQIKEATNAYLTFDTTNSAEKMVAGKNFEIGTMDVDDNSGAVNIADMDVTATAPAATEESLSIAIDGNVIIKAYAESNGSGGIQNQKGMVGTGTILTDSNIVCYEGDVITYEEEVVYYV